MYSYKTSGTCSQQINYDIIDGKVRNVTFVNGCPGNLQAIGILVEGLPMKRLPQNCAAFAAATAAPPAATSWPWLWSSICTNNS